MEFQVCLIGLIRGNVLNVRDAITVHRRQNQIGALHTARNVLQAKHAIANDLEWSSKTKSYRKPFRVSIHTCPYSTGWN